MKHTYKCPCTNQCFDIEVIFAGSLGTSNQKSALNSLDNLLTQKLCGNQKSSDENVDLLQKLQDSTPLMVQIDYSSDLDDCGLLAWPFKGAAKLTLPSIS